MHIILFPLLHFTFAVPITSLLCLIDNLLYFPANLFSQENRGNMLGGEGLIAVHLELLLNMERPNKMFKQ